MTEILLRVGIKVEINMDGMEAEYLCTECGDWGATSLPEKAIFRLTQQQKGFPETITLRIPKIVTVQKQ